MHKTVTQWQQDVTNQTELVFEVVGHKKTLSDAIYKSPLVRASMHVYTHISCGINITFWSQF